MCGSGGGSRRTQFRFHPAEIVSHGRETAMERVRGKAEQLARSALYFAYALPKYSAAADIVVRAQRQPGGGNRATCIGAVSNK